MSFSNLPRPASTTIIPVELAKDIIQIETEVFRSQLKITPLKIDIQRFLKTDKIVHREDSLIRKEAAFKLFMTAVSVALVTLVVLSIISFFYIMLLHLW